ncbi:hypothetical protein [Psychrobacter celer]|uniref:hypothetical protein n=1 Tax=Psychrobacter celer TaxID=306572 RepID=UPI0018E01864|nr:hypothetical protein [Psychrobacter celer]
MHQDNTDQIKSRYALILLDSAILFEYLDDSWQVCPINGEKSNSLRHDTAAASIAEELDIHVNATARLRDIELTVIYDKNASSQIPHLSASLFKLQSENWQLLAWQFINRSLINSGSISHQDNTKYDIEYLSQDILPFIDSMAFGQAQYNKVPVEYNEKDIENPDAVAIKHEKLDAAVASNRELQDEVIRLQHQTNALQGISMQKILTFMPAIYQNFWHIVKPSDIGLLIGSYDIPAIPSPFPEPTIDTIHIMKKQFLALPKQDQRQIIEFCQQLTYPLTIRQEFKNLVV